MAQDKAPNVDSRLLEAIAKVVGKRPRTVLDHILKHGFVTTEDLADYGYNHPPRAARDVREAGIPLETFRVQAKDGRSIGAYRLGKPSEIEGHKLAGRSVLSKATLLSLYEGTGGRCSACYQSYERRYLQIDHRIPYEIGGEPVGGPTPDDFMLLCGSCQRKKSWSCERCPNWGRKVNSVCEGCYWAHPEGYSHIATLPLRRLELVFSGSEMKIYDALESGRASDGVSLAEYVKKRLTDE